MVISNANEQQETSNVERTGLELASWLQKTKQQQQEN